MSLTRVEKDLRGTCLPLLRRGVHRALLDYLLRVSREVSVFGAVLLLSPLSVSTQLNRRTSGLFPREGLRDILCVVSRAGCSREI